MKGKTQGVGIYEVFARAGEPIPDELKRRLDAYAKAQDLYQARNFADAGKAFAAGREAFPKDKVFGLYTERCDYFLANPPAADWNGVWVRGLYTRAMKIALAGALGVAVVLAVAHSSAAQPIELVTLFNGGSLTDPVLVTNAGDGSGNLYAVEAAGAVYRGPASGQPTPARPHPLPLTSRAWSRRAASAACSGSHSTPTSRRCPTSS